MLRVGPVCRHQRMVQKLEAAFGCNHRPRAQLIGICIALNNLKGDLRMLIIVLWSCPDSVDG